jgi:hypothetical protein
MQRRIAYRKFIVLVDGFRQKITLAIDENFFDNFQILGSLGCQGWVVMPKKAKKN